MRHHPVYSFQPGDVVQRPTTSTHQKRVGWHTFEVISIVEDSIQLRGHLGSICRDEWIEMERMCKLHYGFAPADVIVEAIGDQRARAVIERNHYASRPLVLA